MQPATLLLRPLRFALVLSVFATGTLIISSNDAEARQFGKKAGWSNRIGSASSDSSAKRGGLFSKKRTARPKPAAAAPVRRPAAPARTTTSASAPKPQPARRVASTPKPRAAQPEVTSATPAPKRSGLLAKLFGSSRDRTQAAARATSTTGLRRIDSRPAPPKLAPGQPNANQSAPKINHGLIATSSKSQSSVTINISRQRAYCYIGGQVAVDTPVSTARTGKYTPRGSFRVGERVHTGKISTIYKVEMPRWMRLGSSPFGMHAGYLPGYPASAGCIRMPFAAADALYKATGHGTRVKIISG